MKFNKKTFLKSLYKVSTVLFLVGYNFAPVALAAEEISNLEPDSNQSVSATTEEVPEVSKKVPLDTSEDILKTGVSTVVGNEDTPVMMSSSAPKASTNPPLSQTCGLDISLVLDTSGSINKTELAQMKTAFYQLIDALNGTPTQFSLVEFATDAYVRQTFTSDFALVKSKISQFQSGGYTNWYDALLKSKSTFDPRPSKANLIVFASDGNPNRPSNNALSQAIGQADLIKNSGTRILGIGIGSDLNLNNMKAITGPNANTGSFLTSDVVSADFSTLADQLGQFARETCGGTITINKYIDTVSPSTRGGAGWNFTINPDPSNENPFITDENGQVNSGELPTGTYSVIESPLSTYNFSSASCKKSNGTIVGTSTTNGVSNITIAPDDIITCDFVNELSCKAGQHTLEGQIKGNGYTTGNLCAGSGACWAEGDNVPARLTIQGLEVGIPYSVVVSHDYENAEGKVGYENFNNLHSGNNAATDIILSSPTVIGTGPTTKQYTITFTPTNNTVQLDWNALLSEEAGSWSGAALHYRLVQGACGGTGQKEISINPGKIQIKGSITPIKSTDNNIDPLDWSFNIFGLVNVSNVASGDTATGLSLGADNANTTYTITETGLSGYELVSVTPPCQLDLNGNVTVTLTKTTPDVSCTFVNRLKTGNIIVDKVTNPSGDTQSFSFITSDVGYEGFSLTDTETPNSQTLIPGTYRVSESQVDGWYLSDSTCRSSIEGKTQKPSELNLANGETITCTFTNTKYGSISGHKYHDLDGLASTTNDRKAVQGYTIFIDKDGDGKLDTTTEPHTTTAIDGSYSFTGLEPGEYTVVEVMKVGWIVLPGTETSWTFKLSAGENKTDVDFINIERPTIKVIKFVDTDGDGEVDDRYVTDWTWMLDDKEYKMFGKEEKPMEIMPGTYAISEIQKDGYDVKSMMCDNGGVKFFEEKTEGTKLTINSGDKILCRFINTRDTGTLIVRKEVINDNGGKLEAREFSFKIGTSKGVGFDQDPTNPLLGENRFEKYPTGTYSIIEPEANQRGYTTTYDNCDKIVVEKGKEAVCTITNDDVAPTLTVIKRVVNDNGGTATANDFEIKLNGDELKFKTWPGEVGKYTSTYFATPEVKSNTKYELEEIDHPGYKEGKWSCTDDKTGKIIGGYQFSLTEGQRVTCTITNDDIAPSLELVKEVDNKYGGSAQITDWTLTATGPTTIFGDGGVKSKDNFKAGTYTLSETAKEGISGYEAGDWDCTNDIIVNDNNQITLEVGQTTVCTIKNTEIQPTLTLVKTVENNHGGLKQVADFKLYIGDTEVTSGEANKVNSGVEYTVSEDQLDGYTASTWGGDCSADGKITLNSGENKTCTITNSDSQSKITVIKKVINDHGGTATVDDFNITLTDSTLEFDAGVKEGDTTTYTATVFGDVNKEYTLSETVAGTGYHKESLECSLGTNGVFELPEGEDVTCTIVNNDIQPTLTVQKVVDNGRYGDKQVSDFTLYVSGNKVTNGEVNKFNAGDYTVSEDNIDGYVATFSDDCDSDGNVTLNVGDNKVCTITNRSTHGKIIIKKLVEPRGDKTKFTFTGDLTGTIGNNGTIQKIVMPGDYSVTEQSVKGWNLKSLVCDDTDSVKDGYTANIKVGDNETVTCTFTNEKLGSISGFKYEDRNGNGKWDVLPLFSELPLRGWTIFIDANDNGVLDIGERFTKTNILGYYEFTNLPVGETYIIREVQKDGWTQTSANPAPITIAAGDVKVLVNFGNFKDATINVTKDVVGVDGKTNVVDTHKFTALLNNDEDTGKTIAEGTTAIYNVANGKHTISEVEDENYTTLGCFIGKKEFTNYSVRSGETYNVVCKNAQKPATINVTKNVVDVNGKDVVDTTHFRSILTDEDGNQVAEEQKIGEALPPATYTINTMGLYTISEPYSQFFENLGCTILSEGNEVPFTNYSVRSGGKYDVVCTNKQKTATIEVTKDVVGINGEEVKDPTEFTSILSDSDGNQIGEGQIAEGIKAEYKINEMGRYTVSEISDEDYENLGCTVLQSNGEEVLFENYRVRSGGRYRVTCKNAQLPATLIVTKDVVNSEGEDVDGDIFSDDLFDVVLGEVTEQIADTANGKQPAIFEGLQPGVHTFTETPKEGYTFGGCVNDEGVLLDGEVTLGSNQTLEVECINKVIDPILQIEKSNDKQHIDQYAGDEVTYTITVTAPDDKAEGTYVLNDVIVSDIAPAGFKYILGSWTAQKNGVDIPVTEPTYNDANVAQWMIGNMKEGDKVVLTYKTRISLLQDPGNYPDIAWVSGTSLIDGAVLGASTADPLTPFVGTDVTVIDPIETEEGEVLGASITLPVTGASTYLTLGALIMMILGAITLLLKPFKKLSYALLTGLMAVSFVTLLTPNRVLAADEDIKVRIMQPATPTKKSNFNVGFVALDTNSEPITVECYKDAVLFETIPNVNTGNCSAKVDTSGTYTFYVVAKSISGEQKSADVTVVVDLEKPSPVIDYSKAGNVIKFKTPNDGKTKKVEIHRSTTSKYTANEGTRVHSMDVSPNTEYSWTDTTAEAGKTYYYALRTVDAVGNVSTIVSDPEVVEVPTVNTPTATTTTGGEVAGQKDTTEEGEVAGETDDVSEGEDQEVEKTEDGTEKTDIKETAKKAAGKWYIWVIAIVVIGGVAYYVRKQKRD